MAGKGGGAWKVAYADFVTAMMAFFLVMWIVAQNKDSKEAISAYFRDPFGDSSRPSGTGHLQGSELKIKPTPDSKVKGGAKVPILKMIHDRHGTPIGSFVQFVDDSFELDETARQRLDDLTPLLSGKQNKIELRGHTARRRPGVDQSGYDPWRLSYERGMAVMKYLVDHGIDAARIRLSQAGPFEPNVGAEKSDWRLRNARVEIIMLNEYVDDFSVTRRREIAPDADVEGESDAYGESSADAGESPAPADDQAAHKAEPAAAETKRDVPSATTAGAGKVDAPPGTAAGNH